jgi:hypothetical protein
LQFSDLPVWHVAFASRSYPVNPPQEREKLETRSEGKQRNIARLLDCQAKPALMPCADSGQAARNNLAALRNKTLQKPDIAVGDRVDLLRAELADLLAAEELASARTTTGSTGRTWCTWTGARAGVPAAGAVCWCVLLSRLRAAGFVSHDISLSGTLCLPPLQTHSGVSEHSTSCVEWKRKSAIMMRCAMQYNWHRKSLKRIEN